MIFILQVFQALIVIFEVYLFQFIFLIILFQSNFDLDDALLKMESAFNFIQKLFAIFLKY
jgi:hypothetical protein